METFQSLGAHTLTHVKEVKTVLGGNSTLMMMKAFPVKFEARRIVESCNYSV